MFLIFLSPDTDIVNVIFYPDIVFLEREASQGICLPWFPSPCTIPLSLHGHGEDPQMVNLVFKWTGQGLQGGSIGGLG